MCGAVISLVLTVTNCCTIVVSKSDTSILQHADGEAETLQVLKSGSSGTATDDGGSVAQP